MLLKINSIQLFINSRIPLKYSLLELECVLRPTDSRPVRLGIGSPFGVHDQIISFPFFRLTVTLLLFLGRPPWPEDGYIYIYIYIYIYMYVCMYVCVYTYRPSDRRLSGPTFAEGLCYKVSTTYPYGRILDFLDRSRYSFFQVAPQLYPRRWVDQVPDTLLGKSGSAGNRIPTSGSVARNSDH
jgi:hypothetical protein